MEARAATRFLVVDKGDGTLIRTCETEAFFAFHHVNAFEEDKDLFVDLLAYPDDAVIRDHYMDGIAPGEAPHSSGATASGPTAPRATRP